VKRTVADGTAVAAGAGEAGAVVQAAARRPLRELMDSRDFLVGGRGFLAVRG
jgi:hypothetical protein